MRVNRRFLNLVIFTGGAGFLTACTRRDNTKVVVLDPEKINNLNDLIREIKIGAADKLPQNLDINSIYKKLAEVFVEYSHDAIQAGIMIPSSIRNKLPTKKKIVVPALMFFTLWGVKFVIPIASFFNAVLGSLAIMGIFIYSAVTSINEKNKIKL